MSDYKYYETTNPSTLFVSFSGETKEEIIKKLQEYLKDNEIKPNKMQEMLYGSSFDNLSYETKKKIVEENRGTGNTTRQALQFIIDAGNKPGVDAYSPVVEHPVMRLQFLEVVEDLIKKLDFKFYTIDRTKNTMKFDI